MDILGKSIDNNHLRRADGHMAYFTEHTKKSKISIDGKTVTVDTLGTLNPKDVSPICFFMKKDVGEYIQEQLVAELGIRLSEVVDSFMGEVITIISKDPRTEQALKGYREYVALHFPEMSKFLLFDVISQD
jgi:hypothetical protein